MKKVIYYFTGTGNSMRAAKKIAAVLGDTEIISMKNDPEDVPAMECDMIGFVYPVYHWTMPDPVVRFVEKLAINTKAYIFVVAMPAFIVGQSCDILADILQKKNAKLSYGAKVYSVANYVIVYPPIPSPKLVVPRTERKINAIAYQIKDRKLKDYPHSSAFIHRSFPKLMPKYKELQKYADYNFTISNHCTSCGLCSKVCPCNNIQMIEGKPTFKHNCAHCMACVSYCPKRAIGYKITEDDLKQLSQLPQNVPVIKLMGLPAKRKIYHNPYISAAEMIKNREYIRGTDGKKENN